jgi:hypothetical protein
MNWKNKVEKIVWQFLATSIGHLRSAYCIYVLQVAEVCVKY